PGGASRERLGERGRRLVPGQALALSGPRGGPPMRTEALHFDLPESVAARVPPEARGLARDQVRLLVTDRRQGFHRHDQFVNLARYLRPGDLLVVNNSRTMAASLPARMGAVPLRLHLSTDLKDGHWIVERSEERRVGKEGGWGWSSASWTRKS